MIDWLENNLDFDKDSFDLRLSKDHHEVYCSNYGVYFANDLDLPTDQSDQAEWLFEESLKSFLEKGNI